MKSKKTLPYGSLIIGVLIAMIGIACVVMYILEAIVARIGEPDQSLLFWYLPILFIGIIGISIGMGIGIWGVIRLRKIRQEEESLEN
jgi:hypothetical protein